MRKFKELYETLINEEHPIFKKTSIEAIKNRQKEKYPRWLKTQIDQGLINKTKDGYVANEVISFYKHHLNEIPIPFYIVNYSYDCSNNNLTTLKNSPKKVLGMRFDCSYNKLKDLKGGPEYVAGDYMCNNNNLTSLEGLPKTIGGNFDCSNQKSGKEFNENDILKVCKVKGKIITKRY